MSTKPSCSSPPPSKRRRYDNEDHEITLLSLSDDVILRIVHYLDFVSLYRVIQTCRRLSQIGSDKSLWIHPDSGPYSVSLSDLSKIAHRYLGDRTQSLRIRGRIGSESSKIQQQSLSFALLRTLNEKCLNLKSLTLEDHLIDASKIKITDFPDGSNGLAELRLINCQVVNALDRESYFKGIHLKFPRLKTLHLINDGWVSNHSLLAICKVDSLEDLSLRGCSRIGECFVYTALATRFGFRNVKRIDVRSTCIGNSEVQCFGRLPNVTHAYFGDNVICDQRGPNLAEGDGRIEDRGIASLIDYDEPSKLIHLTLTKTELTDKMLILLASKLSSIQILDVRGTKVTEEGLEDFRSKRPTCKLIHS